MRRRWLLAIATVLAAALVLALVFISHSGRQPGREPVRTSAPTIPETAPAQTPAPTPTQLGQLFSVTGYGADPTGQHDSTLAIRNAISAAEAAPGEATVYFPAGTYLLDDNDGAHVDFKIDGLSFHHGINIYGAGLQVTKIIEKVGTVAYPNATPKTVFVLRNVTGTIFGGLTIDSQTYNAGDTVDDYGDYTTIENAEFMGARNRNTFVMRVLAVCNRTPGERLYGVHHTGNTVRNVILSGRGNGGNDDLDFSCQWDGTISDIVDAGWGTALYIDQHVTVTGFQFTPGTEESNPPGFYITESSDITIDGFTTSGNGGVIKSAHDLPSTNITIQNERMTQPGFELIIADASGVTISDSSLSGLRLAPAVNLSNLLIEQTSIGHVTCAPAPGASVTGLSGVSCR